MLNGDKAEINLATLVRTHPTVGALYGSFKLQLDIFKCPMRYYNSLLHNNKKNIGMNMKTVFMPSVNITGINPQMVDPATTSTQKRTRATAQPINTETGENINENQIHPSSLLHYLGISGLGTNTDSPQPQVITRNISNAIPILAYYDIYANYYANLQEDIGAVLGQTEINPQTIERIYGGLEDITALVLNTDTFTSQTNYIIIYGLNLAEEHIYLNINIADNTTTENSYRQIAISELRKTGYFEINTDRSINEPTINSIITITRKPTSHITSVNIQSNATLPLAAVTYDQDPGELTGDLTIQTFDITNIDTMRENILAFQSGDASCLINNMEAGQLLPYLTVTGTVNDTTTGTTVSGPQASPMAGLALKTYQSDRFNNWIKTDFINGPNGANTLSAIDVSSGTLEMDTLNLQQKIYNLLNRVALSGGTYKDWQEAVYGNIGTGDLEIPEYCGGASAEIQFNEVVSTSAVEDEALGTLGGRGIQTNLKGNRVEISCREPQFIIGLVSITPRIDYCQGNKWWTRIKTMDDWHKPELDGIGFQDLILDEIAAWTTQTNVSQATEIQTQTYKTGGKQPAWIEYTTNQNQTHGNFATGMNESFMVLNRRYEPNRLTGNNYEIADMTTYIDPVKYNYAFARDAIESQHFWVQIGIDLKMTRVMADTQIPRL